MPHCNKCSGLVRGTRQRAHLASKSQFNQASEGCTGQTTYNTAYLLVPGTKAPLQSSSRVHELLWKYEGKPPNIRQVVLTLWLISAYCIHYLEFLNEF